MTKAIFGPTFEVETVPGMPPVVDPINLYSITWRGVDDSVKYEVMPAELTGVDAPIVVLYGRDFPTGSHKVCAAYSVLADALLLGL